MALKLEICDYKDASHWYCRLMDGHGKLLADHEVKLNPADPEYEAFIDLRDYLRHRAAPDRREADEKRLITQVGAWIGRNVYGPIADKILAAGTPAVVRVEIPAEPDDASGLLYRPWELGHAGGRPLALQDVSLVFEIKGESPAVVPKPVEGALRMLAVFSLPTDVNALNLRHERYRLQQLIRNLAVDRGLAIHFRVLQYGVTREALRKILREGAGWDILHFSGHGLQAHLVLEKEDGTKDLVTSDELLNLVRPARGRLKWVTLSACLSAAATVQETLLWLGVDPKRAGLLAPAGDAAPDKALPALARSLVRDLDCAVVAMRYPVGDAFAIDLAENLYGGVLEQGQTLPSALQTALNEAAGDDDGPLSIATPALFGRQCAELSLQAPVMQDVPPDAERPGMAFFAMRPGEHFVGRVGVLSEASRALAPKSRHTGVLFHGMAGGGKTACALELAFHYEDLQRFTHFVWYKAPEEGHEIVGALAAFASAWETQLEELKPPPLLIAASAETAKFEAFLPRVTEFLRKHSVLFVLDNLESLLRPTSGEWRDERWAKLIAAMLDHDGQSRLLLTSRVRPVPANRHLLELAVHSLSLDEAALLARQLPNLGRLLRDDRSRPLVRRTLEVVQGHPKLIDFAEKQAASAEALKGHLERAESASPVGKATLAAFFDEGQSALGAPEFLATLGAWTASLVDSLAPDAREFFYFLCCLEEGDREGPIIEANWSDYWKRLSKPGEAPAFDALTDAAGETGLLEVVTQGAEYHIHPGVAEAGRAQAGEARQAATDEELAAFWQAVFVRSQEREMSGGGPMILRGGRSAVPYLMRRSEWDRASALLEEVTSRDTSPETLAAVVPLLRRIAQATERTPKGLEDAGVLAGTLAGLGQVEEAERITRRVLADAEHTGQFRAASCAAHDLIKLLWKTGRAKEALGEVEDLRNLTRRAGLGPWTQLLVEAVRPQILVDLGRYDEVLEAVKGLREQMQGMRESGEAEESVSPWNVRETILDTGREAALRDRRWQEALDFNREIIEIKKARGATAHEIARKRFNDNGPLRHLQRYSEAQRLLLECRRQFEDPPDAALLGRVFIGLANLEAEIGHLGEAVAYEHTALRYVYYSGALCECAACHFNLANIMGSRSDPQTALAHRLASAVIWLQTSDGFLANAVQALSLDLSGFSPSPPPLPANFEQLCEIVERVEGVRFRELFSRLPTENAATGDEALQKVLDMARAQETDAPEMPEELKQLIAPVFEAASTGQDIEPPLAALHERLSAAMPDQQKAVDEFVAQIRKAAAGSQQ